MQQHIARGMAHGVSKEDAKRQEAEAAMALLRGWVPVEYAYATLGVLGEVTVWGLCSFQEGGWDKGLPRHTYMTSCFMRYNLLGNALSSTLSSCISIVDDM